VPRYRIVPEHSTVWIDARSNVHPIHSSMDGLEGYIELAIEDGGRVDLSVAPRGTVSLPVSRLSSGNRFEDRELQKRLSAKLFPTIKGVLTAMEPAGDEGRYRVSGDVAFRGVTRACRDEMTVTVVDELTLRLDGRSTFDIRDFGMEPPRFLMLKVEPDVVVRVDIVAETER
jgi:polyisoprenoid-binding protein YceI